MHSTEVSLSNRQAALDKREVALVERKGALTLELDKREAALALFDAPALDTELKRLKIAVTVISEALRLIEKMNKMIEDVVKKIKEITFDRDQLPTEFFDHPVIKDYRTTFWRTTIERESMIGALHAVAKERVLNSSAKDATRFAIAALEAAAKKGEPSVLLRTGPCVAWLRAANIAAARGDALGGVDAPAKGGALGGVDAPECPVIPRDDPVCIKRLKGLYSLIRRA